MVRTIHIDQRKWPDKPHWHFDAEWLGSDEHGGWCFLSADAIVQRGDEPSRPAGVDMVPLIPRNEPWMVEFYRNHPNHEVYVNIGTVPAWEGDRVVQIDLDLDVIRSPTGEIITLDENEFIEHRRILGYPADIVAHAVEATRRTSEQLENGVEPFGLRRRHGGLLPILPILWAGERTMYVREPWVRGHTMTKSADFSTLLSWLGMASS